MKDAHIVMSHEVFVEKARNLQVLVCAEALVARGGRRDPVEVSPSAQGIGQGCCNALQGGK